MWPDCLDHFLESDIYLHCWEISRQILEGETCCDIVLEIRMPIEHKDIRCNWYVKHLFKNRRNVILAGLGTEQQRIFGPPENGLVQ